MPSHLPSALYPKTWPFNLEDLPPSAYLVGGAVRDALLDRTSDFLDLDFVLPEKAVETARQLAKQYKAGFVLLDAKRQIARVVFQQATADFALQEGETLEADLHRRDFTVNAIAWNPHTGSRIDPLHGYADLQRGCLRMVSPENLKDDPLRLLRAYRQAAQLGFTLEPETRKSIRQLAPLLSSVAAERANSEFSYLLRTPAGTPWLIAAWEDGLLEVWFPSAGRDRVCQLKELDRGAISLGDVWPALLSDLCCPIRPTLKATWMTIAKLASLVSVNFDTAERELSDLKYSRAESRGVLALLKASHQTHSAEAIAQLSVAEQLFWFKAFGPVFSAWAVWAVASGLSISEIAPLVDRYLTPDDPIAHPQPLVSGKELMAALDLPKGPQIGRLLEAIQMARAEGKILTPAEAIQWARDLSDRQG